MAVKNKDRSLFGGGGRSSEDGPASGPHEGEVQAEVEQLEKDINELRATYELFFMGVERVEPQPQRDLIKSKLRRFQEQKPRNTALKFRIQQLKARMVSLENYWNRTQKQREAGVYHRDLARVKRKEAELAKQNVSAVGSVSSSTANKQPQSGQTSLRPRASSAEDLTDAKLKKLYDTYLGARRRCGESTDLRFDDMASELRKQVPRLMNKTGAHSVEFKVVIRSGKAVLKALPRIDSQSE